MITATNVNKFFYIPEQMQALNNVSASVAPGEVLVIIGPSGARWAWCSSPSTRSRTGPCSRT